MNVVKCLISGSKRTEVHHTSELDGFGTILPSSDRGPVPDGQLEHSLLSAHLSLTSVIDDDQELLNYVVVSLYNLSE